MSTLEGGELETVKQNLLPKERVKLTNQSLVFEVFGDDEKLTIREIAYRVNENLPREGKISEQTIRRAVTDLTNIGQLKAFGKVENAQTYGKLSASFTGKADDQLIPFGGNLISVEEFLKLLSDPELRPLKKQTNLLAEKSQHGIRRMMLFAILSAGEAGNDDALKKVNEQLHNAIGELQFALTAIEGFVNSAVWFPIYRDKIALAVREVVKNDPELYKLAMEYMRAE